MEHLPLAKCFHVLPYSILNLISIFTDEETETSVKYLVKSHIARSGRTRIETDPIQNCAQQGFACQIVTLNQRNISSEAFIL